MGAVEFVTSSRGKTPEEAFTNAVEEAQYDYGHAGYTGTIAEKPGFEMRKVPKDTSIKDYIDKTIDDNDKWGDAYCIQKFPSDTVEKEFVFYGNASC
jgi:hypothetical protein